MANLADVNMIRGDWETAHRYARDGVELQKEGIDLGERAGAHHNLGLVLFHKGAIAEAAAHARLALKLSTDAGDFTAIFPVFVLASALACACRLSEDSARLLGAADAMRQRLGDSSYQPVEARVYQNTREQLEEVLGETQFAHAYEAGASLPLDALIDLGDRVLATCAASSSA